MSAAESAVSPKLFSANYLVKMLIGAVAGAALSYIVVTILEKLHVSARSLSWSDFLAFWLGVTFIGVALIVIVISFNRRELARNIEGQSARLPATNEEVRNYRLQSLTLLLAGVMLLLPVASVGTIATLSHGSGLVFAAIVVLFVLQTVVNIRIWRFSDEFIRGQMLQVSALTFAYSQGALFLWAAAEHLHLVRPISSWDILTLLMTVYLVTSSYIGIKSRPGA